MRRRVLILLAAAFLAMISGAAVLGYAHSADERAVKGKEARWVLLAVETIPANTTFADIRAKNLVRQVRMPVETVPEGAIEKLDDSMDKFALNAPLQPDQMLLRGQFVDADAAPKPVPTFEIPDGRLAVSISLKVNTQVAGNVDIGDEVTVFGTYPAEKDTQTKDPKQTFVLLPRVKVISVGERSATPAPVEPTPSAGASVSGSEKVQESDDNPSEALDRYVVTLAVTPQEANWLINATHTSDLQLGMIGPGVEVTADPDLAELMPTSAAPTEQNGSDT